jgi:hypothetical protein
MSVQLLGPSSATIPGENPVLVTPRWFVVALADEQGRILGQGQVRGTLVGDAYYADTPMTAEIAVDGIGCQVLVDYADGLWVALPLNPGTEDERVEVRAGDTFTCMWSGYKIFQLHFTGDA